MSVFTNSFRTMRRRPLTLVAALAAAAFAATIAAQDAPGGGAAPYTPTKAEWLCLVLNTQVALVTGEQQPNGMLTRFVCERSQPDTVVIETLLSPTTSVVHGRREAELAAQWLRKAAKLRGWDSWLKVEFKQGRISGPPELGNVEP